VALELKEAKSYRRATSCFVREWSRTQPALKWASKAKADFTPYFSIVAKDTQSVRPFFVSVLLEYPHSIREELLAGVDYVHEFRREGCFCEFDSFGMVM
jgi:hypothetical protein